MLSVQSHCYRPARQLAMQALYQHHFVDYDLSQLREDHIERSCLPQIQQQYFNQLVLGVVNKCHELDERLVPLLDRPLAHLDILERVLLRIGAYELHEHPDLPVRQVIAENVYLAGIFGATGSHKYVNAILHKLAQEQKLL